MSEGLFHFLGTGGSLGVPIIGCGCSVCLSVDPCNKRLRSSGWVQLPNAQLLIDAGPDFRQQALRTSIQRLDALLLTHTHFDHIAGIDELRIYNFRQQKPLTCFLSHHSHVTLQQRYAYLFAQNQKHTSSSAEFDFQQLLEHAGSFQIKDYAVHYLSYKQGDMPVTGYRIGNLAYLTDIRQYEEDIFSKLEGVQILIISAMQQKSSAMHLSFEQAIAFAQKLGAVQTWITHLSDSMYHHEINRLLPSGVQCAYDGLVVPFYI